VRSREPGDESFTATRRSQRVMIAGMTMSCAVGPCNDVRVDGTSYCAKHGVMTGRNAPRVPRKVKTPKDRPDAQMKFAGIVLTAEGQLVCEGKSHPVAGATARVETFGQLTERVTSRLSATRIVGLGVFALAAPKRKKTKTDTRESYLTVSGQGFEFVKSVKPSQGLEARKFAALVNTRASAS
jgi:hypothetical protein